MLAILSPILSRNLVACLLQHKLQHEFVFRNCRGESKSAHGAARSVCNLDCLGPARHLAYCGHLFHAGTNSTLGPHVAHFSCNLLFFQVLKLGDKLPTNNHHNPPSRLVVRPGSAWIPRSSSRSSRFQSTDGPLVRVAQGAHHARHRRRAPRIGFVFNPHPPGTSLPSGAACLASFFSCISVFFICSVVPGAPRNQRAADHGLAAFFTQRRRVLGPPLESRLP